MSAAPLLTVSRDGQTLKEQEIQGEVVLGRDQDCVLRLDDRAISRKHAVLRPVANGLQVEKKSEFGPLSVNGAECTSAILKEGDIIAVGPYLIRITLPISSSEVPAGASTVEAEVSPAVGSDDFPDDLGLAPDSSASQTDENQDTGLPPLSTEDSLPLPEASEAPLTASESPQQSIQQDENSVALPALGETAASEAGDSLPIEGQEANELSQPSDAAPSDALGVGDPLATQSEAVNPEDTPDLVLGAEGSADAGPQEVDTTNLFEVDPDGATKVLGGEALEAILVFPEGAADTTEYRISKEETYIGRSKKCDVTLKDKKASRKHVLIRRSGIQFTIKDLGSANGTYVNGARIQQQELSGEDRIRIGDTKFTFQATSADFENQQQDFLNVEEATEGDASQAIPDSPLAPSMQTQPGMPPTMPPPPAMAPAPVGAVGQEGVPGLTGVPGIPGTESTGKQSLLEKFRALPKHRQIIWMIIILGLTYFLLDEDPLSLTGPQKKTAKTKATTKVEKKVSRRFEDLSPQQQEFVESQHALAFEYFKNKEYDKALFEVQKIFTLVDQYKDARDIERYAKEGKLKMEAREADRRKKEEEARLKAKIAELLSETQRLMDEKKYSKASQMFPQILALDPENELVIQWQRKIAAIQEQREIEEQERRVRAQLNAEARDVYEVGQLLVQQSKYKEGIKEFRKIPDIGATDRKLLARAKKAIEDALAAIQQQIEPLLEEAKSLEDGGQIAEAYKIYEKILDIDPGIKEAVEGMDRIRGTLLDRAKFAYTEAVISESYSDFDTAKNKFEETMKLAPIDNVYYQRAKRKLKRYYHVGAKSNAEEP